MLSAATAEKPRFLGLGKFLLVSAIGLTAACQSGSLQEAGGNQAAASDSQTAPVDAAATTTTTATDPNLPASTVSASANGSTADALVVTDTWLTAPTYAQAFRVTNNQLPNIDFVGVSRQANAQASLQVSDLTQTTEAWTTIATTQTAQNATTTKQEQLYSYSFKNVVLTRAQWPQGGAVRVRVVVGQNSSVSFDARSQACQALLNNATWTDFARNCGSNRPFTTLVDDGGSAPAGSVNFLLPPDGNQTVVDSVNKNETRAYLKATGLTDRAPTLAAFQARYKLGGAGVQNNPADTNAIYYNFGDLGFGREMHCNKADNGDIGCAVTNYGQPGGEPNNSLALTISKTNPIATVAMEYRATASSDPVTFMVYDGAGNPLEEATLDSQGNKPTPLICLSCHGGTYDTATHSIKGTNFLPFDTDELLFSNQRGFTLNDQADTFRALNALVAATAPSDGIKSLITGWYGNVGVATQGAKLDNTFVPAGWKDQTDLYTNVVKPYCRSCHNSLTGALSWPTSKEFVALAATIQRDVCTAATMPRSEQTVAHFFQSGARATLIDALKLQTACNPK